MPDAENPIPENLPSMPENQPPLQSRGLPLWLLAAWLAVLLALWPVVQRWPAGSTAVSPEDLIASARLVRQQRYPEALEAARRYLRLKPDSAEALTNMGVAWAAMGKWDEAIEATHRALLIKPADQLEWNDLRFILARKLAAHPTAESYYESAFEHYSAGRYRECVAAASQALLLYPQYTKAFNLLSVCYLNLGKYDDAIRNAQEALRIEPTFQLAANNLRLAVQAKAKGSPPAAPVAVNPTAINPAATNPTADSLLNSSLAKYRAGDKQGCVDDARAALRLDPKQAIAWNNVAACSNDLGHPDEAIAAATQALRLQPDFPLARNNLSVAISLKASQAKSASPAK